MELRNMPIHFTVNTAAQIEVLSAVTCIFVSDIMNPGAIKVQTNNCLSDTYTRILLGTQMYYLCVVCIIKWHVCHLK